MRKLLGLLLLLALHGCVVGPDYERPDLPIPDAFQRMDSQSFKVDGISLSRWWESFEDPVLSNLIDTAFQNNYDLRFGALRVLEARANYGTSGSGLFPELSITGSAASSEGSDHASAVVMQTENYQFGTDLQWELDFWGRVRRSIESADASLNATESDFRDLRVIISSEVARLYIQYRSAQQRLALTIENVRIQKKALSDTKALFDEGDNTLLDVSQAEAVFSDTQALLPSLVRERINARNGLSTLLALPFGEIDRKIAEPADLPLLNRAINVGVPTDILRQRPDIQAAEWSAISAAAEVGIREADRRPGINLAGSLLFQVIDGIPTKAGGVDGSSLSDLFDGDSLSYSLMPSLRLPIFDAKKRKNSVRAADARYQSALEQFEQAVITALQEIDDAMAQVETSKQEAVYLKASVAAYVKAYDTAAIQYEEGDVAFQSVLDSLRQRVSQELNLVRAQSNASLGIVSLFKALGGGWQNVQTPMLPKETIEEMRARTNWGDLLGEQ